MTLSDDGIKLIKHYESCSLKAYKDSGGVYTIGWGHTGKSVGAGLIIDQNYADMLFAVDAHKFDQVINKLVKVPLKQYQFDALTSLCFNIGEHAFAHSSLLEVLNQKNYDLTANKFLQWVYDNGKILKGLQRRRTAEKSLFLGYSVDEAIKRGNNFNLLHF